jgi:hypothetical protein
MEHPLYSVPVIQQDLRQEETILQIADALDYLDQVVNDIFARVESRIANSKARLEALHRRASLAKMKIEKLTGSSKATKVSEKKFCFGCLQPVARLIFIVFAVLYSLYASVLRPSSSAIYAAWLIIIVFTILYSLHVSVV